MGYRDEKEQLRARVSELEEDLGEAEDRIARLRGDASSRVVADEQHSKFLNAPKLTRLVEELPFEVSMEGYEQIAALLQKNGVTVAQVGRRLSGGAFSLVFEDGVTRISHTLDWKALPAAVLSGAGVGGLFGMGLTIGFLQDVMHLDVSPAIGLWVLPALAIPMVFGFRSLAKKSIARARAQWSGVFEQVLEIAAEHAVESEEAPAAKVRVEADAEEQEERADQGKRRRPARS